MTRSSPKSLDHARRLRKDMTDAERALWRLLRDRRIDGWRFRRQEPIDRYIVDFVCFDARLVIEVDGGQHNAEVDGKRTAWLEGNGYRVLRFWNNEMLTNMDGVLQTILAALTPDPLPSHQPGGPCPTWSVGSGLIPQAGEGA